MKIDNKSIFNAIPGYLYDNASDQLSLCLNQNKICITKREMDVLKQLLLGNTAKMIARELNISFRTVEGYIFSLKLKLGCHSKNHLIKLCVQLGLFKHFFQ
ncbi:MAG: helix-turn-helix transcriptional regulator [Gammaproteobacteria bacterium]